MTIDLLFGTNGNRTFLQPFLESVFAQTIQPTRIVMLIYPQISQAEYDGFIEKLHVLFSKDLLDRLEIISHRTHEYQPGNDVGYDRYFLVKQATSEYIYMIDHDNIFPPDFFAQTIEWYRRVYKEIQKPFLLSPTILRGPGKDIQSRGITGVNYRLMKYQGVVGFTYPLPRLNRIRQADTDRTPVSMMGANSLFGPTKIFQEIQFDPALKVCYEDVDFTRRAVLHGYPMIVINALGIHHGEPARSGLEHLMISTPRRAYFRARNRTIFIRKTATRWQQRQYFGSGIWIQTVWFLVQTVKLGGKDRWRLAHAILLGTRDGLWNRPSHY